MVYTLKVLPIRTLATSLFICLFFQRVYLGIPEDWGVPHLKDGVGCLGEVWLVLAMKDPMGQWRLDLGVVELLDCWRGHLLAAVSSTYVI